MTLLPLVLVLALAVAGDTTYRLDVHHRFSDRVRRWAEARSLDAGEWPERGTVEYYRALADRDRRLSGEGADLTFSDGNLTLMFPGMGLLHYAEVELGTPRVSFLVALDTGSDLFWVPCECQRCAPLSSEGYGLQDFDLSLYNPNSSLTSKKIFCNNTLCEPQSTCSTSDPCPYKVAYVASGTSSTGLLVEDNLYLTTDDTHQEDRTVRVVFGCGQIQTGLFLDSAAPNGLLGLGMEKTSIPTMLANAGLVSNSFSMCFDNDSTGRISFGDQGISDQEETPFILSQPHPTYVITVTGMKVGNKSFIEGFDALVDSGTSFTSLAEPAYTQFTHGFNSQVKDNRQSTDSQIPFEYCYVIKSNQSQTHFPSVSFMTKGGSEFPVFNPVIVINVQTGKIYCLAVVKSRELNVIGQNFMTGLRIVFDREKLILGWKKFDCYSMVDSSVLPVRPSPSSLQSPPFVAQSSSLNPEAAKQTGNTTQISYTQPSSSQPLCLCCHQQVFLLLFSLLAVIL